MQILHRLLQGQPMDRVSSHSNASALPEPLARNLPNCLIGQSSTARYHTHISRSVNVPRHNANLTGTRGNDSRTVRPNQHARVLLQRMPHSHHIHHWDPFRNRHDQLNSRIRRLQNRISGKLGWNKNHRCICPGCRHRLRNRVKDRHGIFKHLSPTRRGYPRDHLSPILLTGRSMERTRFTGNSLHQESCIRVDENRHLICPSFPPPQPPPSPPPPSTPPPESREDPTPAKAYAPALHSSPAA